MSHAHPRPTSARPARRLLTGALLLVAAALHAEPAAVQDRADRFLALANASYQSLITLREATDWDVSTDVTSPVATKARIIARSLELGFADCRVAAAQPAAHRAIYEQWIAEG